MLKKFKLIKKYKLTSEIFELTFESDDLELEKNFKFGQFITFILPEIGGRAYSILEFLNKNTFILIIKKREKENGGRGGSKYICEKEVGEILQGVGPSGHFTLQETNKNKIFLATGTGVVPLYNQILGALEKKVNSKIMLIFGARIEKDLFYIEKLEKLKNKNKNFDYKIYLSKENSKYFEFGYITDFLDKKNIGIFEEFYICGAPVMMDSSIKKLKKLGIIDKNIYFEKY